MKDNKIVAGIVTYNPDMNRLRENINSIIFQVDKLIIIDNNSRNKNEIYFLKKEYQYDIIQNDENFGISYALNQILSYAKNNGYKWMISLDQDSVVDLHLIEKYSLFFNMPKLAMLTCSIRDRNSCIEPKHYSESYYLIKECITSGCCANTRIINKLGGYDNKLFIDTVDLEMCYRVVSNGYKIVKINYDGLLHELGSTTNVKICKRVISIFNENEIRNYYMSRNLLYCFAKTKSLHFVLNFIIHFFKVALFENNKRKKFIYIFKGIKDALSGNMGKLKEENINEKYK